jgi:hemoglobin-like flavoprotein
MPLDIDNLETSFDLVAPRGEQLVSVFYARLFEAAPQVRELFPADMKRQRAMLLAVLVLLRKSVRNIDALVPTLRALGARHAGYGAQPEHYPLVGQTLVGSMAFVAGDAWRHEYAQAWSDAFDVIAAVMISGADDAVDERAAA